MELNGCGNISHHVGNALVVRPLQHTGYKSFYHATEHLHTFASQLLLNCPNNRLGKSHARSTLKRGEIADLLAQMQALSKKICGERCVGYDI